jgi:hypothetical protein
LDVVDHLVLEILESNSHVIVLFHHDLTEERCQFSQRSVVRITVPRFDKNAVIRLVLKVLCYVIYDDAFGE